MKTKFSALFICCILSFPLFAQGLAEWGELRNYEMEMKVCSFDTSAGAVVLSDFVRIDKNPGEPLTFQYHKRIKILKENEKDRADIIIPYYHNSGFDKITSIRAQTLNIEKGKVVKTTLKQKDFFWIKMDEYYSELRFSFPDVKAGSIIEYSYIVETESYISLTKWSFQTDIPTLFSQATAYIEQRFNYRISYQGLRLQQKYKEGSHNTWLLTNLPKIEPVSYCANFFDYTEQINFQLESFYSNAGDKITVIKTWEKFAKDFLDETEFSKILNKQKTGEKIIESIIDENDAPIEKIKKLYHHVSSTYQWNEYYGIQPDVSLKNLLDKKSGGADDINTYLILLLRSAGFEANPVLISTKDHGIISKSTPFIDQFNLLICNVNLDGKDILLDASKSRRPYHLLDEDNLNRYGFLLDEQNPRWVEIPVNNESKTFKMVTMELVNPQEIKYKYEVSSRAYDALDMRIDIHKSGLKQYVLTELIRENAEVTLDSLSSVDTDNPYLEKPTIITAFISDKNLSIVNDDFVYLNPFVDAFDASNPFNDEERHLPVDLYYPFEEGYILNLTIPDDYEVIEYPETMNLKLAEDKGFLKCSSSLNGNKLQLRISLIFKDYFFQPSEYPFLKELYDTYIKKRQEQIVLKKKT